MPAVSGHASLAGRWAGDDVWCAISGRVCARSKSPGRGQRFTTEDQGRCGWSAEPRPSSGRSPRPTGTAAPATVRRDRRREAPEPSRRPHTAHFDPDPWLRLQVADVVGLRSMGGDQPERVADQAVADRGLPWQPAAAAGGLQQRERPGRAPARKAWRISRLLPRSRLVTRRYFRDRISPVVPPAAAENVRSATRGRTAERAGR